MNRATTEAKADVLIVGGGPVGLSLAIELGRLSVRCLVIEQRERETPHPRAKLTNVRTMTLMRRWGIADDVRAAAPLPASFPSDVAFVTRLTGWELARIPDALSTATRRDAPFPEAAQQIPQGELERILRKTAEALPTVDLLTGVRLEDFSVSDGRIEAVAVDLSTGAPIEIEATFLAGCDGARSRVREVLEIPMEGDELLADNVGAVIHAPSLWSLHDKDPAVHYWLINAESPGILGPLDADETWWLHLNETPPGERLTDERVRELFFAAVGRELPCEVLANVPWRAQRLLAARYRAGPVFLLGDAAHLHPPMGGYGMNMGIGDAVDLGWKLGAVLAGWGGLALLDSYELERRPIHEWVLEEAAANYTRNSSRMLDPQLEADDAAGAAARRAAGTNLKAAKTREFASLGVQLGYRYEESPLTVADGTQATSLSVETFIPTARPGHLVPHAWLDEGHSLYDELGEAMTMLVLGGAAGPDQVRAAAADSPVPIEVVDLGGRELRDLFEADLVLVRPDHHVAWRGSDLTLGITAALQAAGH